MRGPHSIAREVSISPISGYSRLGIHFSARFFLAGLPLARLTGPPPGGGLGRARVVSWGRAQSSKRSSFPVDGTALESLHYSCQNHAVPLVHIYI